MNFQMKKCPLDDLPLEEIGSVGIVHWDDIWEAETTRYRCRGGHMIFITDAAPIDEAENEHAEPSDA